MTAPDPGLTDLIAAHTTNWERRCLGGDESYLQCDCGDEFEDELSWAAHLKLVVEQHTNGRIAELDWDELVAAIPDGWELRESTQLEEVSRVRQRDLEASQATTERWRTRAQKAEATMARVEAEAALLERMIRTAPWSRYTEVRRSHLRSLCAALERPGDAG
uniref:hypothetical protein n=1 Tax=Rhodococcus qingshengii TaxID=334542 RepID=UPI001C4DE761|nr:hypothetical protein [Rhodococcus qingshengii]